MPHTSEFDPALPRLVLDTNVWLDLLLFDDPRCAALRADLGARRCIALTDTACRAEWHRVLVYPGLGLDSARIAALHERFDALVLPLGEALRPLPWPALPRCRDPDDQKFLELALAGHAALLLSRDAELLRLARRCERAGLFRISAPEGYPSA